VTLLVTVVITTHDRRELLAESLASVLAQDWPRLEVVVVDDAGRDGTWAWLEQCADPRVKPLRLTTNTGFPGARNAGLAAARGELVLFLDDDDLLLPTAVHRLAAALARALQATAATGVELGFDGAERWLNCIRPRRPLVRDVWPDVLAGLWITGAGRTLFRTDVLRRAGGWDESVRFGEDDELWLRLAPRGPVAVVPDDVLLYRSHTNRARPPDAKRTERAFRRRFVDGAPVVRGRRGRRLLHAWEHIDDAGTALAADRPGWAAVRYAAALVHASELLASPFSRLALLPALAAKPCS